MFALRAGKSVSKNGGLCMLQCRSKYTLPDLPYKFKDLEPIISAEIMELHHQKHHGGYVNNLNKLIGDLEVAIKDNQVNKIVNLGKDIKFNAGGHINHALFWKNLCPPDKCKPPPANLLSAITSAFGSYDNLITKMSAMAVSIQGSGWAWLAYNPMIRHLQLEACQNQDPLQPTTGLIPLLGIDVWEHAYYLQYKNVRAEYVKKIWEVVNWQEVAERYAQAEKKYGPMKLK